MGARATRAAAIVLALAAEGIARAGVPLSLPPGERASDWATAAEMAGFSLGAPPGPNGAGVALVATEAGWVIRVREADGTERRVPVAVPRDAAGREDTLWVTASLAAPLMEAALNVPQRAQPRATAVPALEPAVAPTPAPPPAPPPAPAPVKSAAPKASPPKSGSPKSAPATPPPPVVSTPAPEQPSSAVVVAAPAAPEPVPPVATPTPVAAAAPPVLAAPASPRPAPEAPAVVPAETTSVPGPPMSVRPTVTASGGLGAARAVTGLDDPATLAGQAQLRAGVALGSALEIAARAELQSSSPLEAFDGGERWGRAEIGLDVGVLRRGAITWGPRASLSFVRYRFSTDEDGGLGGLGLPGVGAELTLARPIGEDWTALAGVGVDRDLREVQVQQDGTDQSYALPRSHLSLLIGIGWGP